MVVQSNQINGFLYQINICLYSVMNMFIFSKYLFRTIQIFIKIWYFFQCIILFLNI